MINLNDIHITFNQGTPLESKAVRGVTLEVPDKQFLTVIGSNGAGKSTILNSISGSAGITKGSITVADQDVTSWPVYKRSKLVSRVFQDPRLGTCPDLTILENFALAYGRTVPRGFARALFPKLIEEIKEKLSILNLGLENRLDDQVGQLSGGQRQALSLIMATTGESRVLLLDEHTAALDPETAHDVMELTKKLVDQFQLTTIMITHSMQQALDYGHRTVMFHRGKMVFDVEGEQRNDLTVNDLLALFSKNSGEQLSDDALLLS